MSATPINPVNAARVRVPPAFMRYVRRQILRRTLLILAIAVPCLLLLEYCLWGHVSQVVEHFSVFLAILALAQPLQFFSRGPWTFVINKDGVFLRDENSPLNLKGHPLLQWKHESLIETAPAVWQGGPALSLSYRRLGHMGQKTITLPYRPEDEEVVAQTLVPSLTARLRFKD